MDDDLHRMRIALDMMPADQRCVFERARFHGEDYPTIAAHLGIGVGEVERLMALAMTQMVQALDP